MKKFLLFLIILLAACAFWYYSKQDSLKLPINTQGFLEFKEGERSSDSKTDSVVHSENLALPKVNANDVVIKRIAYTLSFSEAYEQAEWVAYTLSRSEVLGLAERRDNFKMDKDISTGSASLSDYKRSGFDRGHLAPAADMSKNQKTMDESFFMSNMSPQEPGFNRGIWKTLEAQVREWTLHDTLLYVVTGPVLTQGLKTIGDNKVAVPDYYYKVIADFSEPNLKCIAFLMPNKKSKESIYNYVVSIDSLEKVTGLDFYHLLPDAIENKLESTTNWMQWE